VTEQVADAPVPASVQGEPVKVPVLPVVNATVPLGVIAVPAAVSVTVTVHVDGDPTFTVFGLQVSLVVVVRRLTVTLALPVLPRWLVSPP